MHRICFRIGTDAAVVGAGGGAQLVRTDRLCKCRTPIESSEDGLSSCSTPGGIEQFAESGKPTV